MKTRSVHDEQIDNLATTAMQATLEALVVSGDMTRCGVAPIFWKRLDSANKTTY